MPRAPQRSISVVICAYADDRWEHLHAAVASVKRQSHPAHEIIVVVDHNQGLFSRLEHSLHGVALVESSGRKGLRDARNSGIRAASGDIIAFVDDDAVADREWL